MRIPKFNNKVNAGVFDARTSVELPASRLFTATDSTSSDDGGEMLRNEQPVAVVGYLMLRTFGDLLGHTHAAEIQCEPRSADTSVGFGQSTNTGVVVAEFPPTFRSPSTVLCSPCASSIAVSASRLTWAPISDSTSICWKRGTGRTRAACSGRIDPGSFSIVRN